MSRLSSNSGEPESGVSIVICCHNSSQRLPQTLSHLASQQVTKDVSWEIIVVDNASTDGTGRVAREYWQKGRLTPLRIVSEPKLGLINARLRGFAEAKYELISFIDDDNWLNHKWVQVVSEVMRAHPEVGACGGKCEAVSDIEFPWWFEENKRSFAIGSQGNMPGDVTTTRGYLWGAGFNVRKSAWQLLLNKGFRPLLSGRRGNVLSAGEDSELCFALRLAGWRLWYEPRLKLRHFLPAQRLRWDYLCRLYSGFGVADVGLGVYRYVLQCEFRENKNKSRGKIWINNLKINYRDFRTRFSNNPRLFISRHEGDPEVLRIYRLWGELRETLRWRSKIDAGIGLILNATWRVDRNAASQVPPFPA